MTFRTKARVVGLREDRGTNTVAVTLSYYDDNGDDHEMVASMIRGKQPEIGTEAQIEVTFT